MNATKGYFSIVQYCPDFARLEAVNVGVVLFCPERHFIKAKLVSRNNRIQRFFGKDSIGNQHLNDMKASLAQRLKVEESNFTSLEAFQTFIATRANSVILTPAKPMKVFDPEQDLSALYEELVLEPSKPMSHQVAIPLRKRLDEVLLEQDVRRFLREDITVHVPVLKEDLELPYGYQNGRFNLIQPIEFKQQSISHVKNAACKTAIEGWSLYKEGKSEFGDLQLVVVADFEDSNSDVRSLVQGILSEGSVEMFTSDSLGDLKHEILTQGKPI